MNHQSEIEAARIIEKASACGDFVTEVDGFVYFLPSMRFSGCMSSWMLRVLADEIDRRNEPVEKSISDYFEGKES